MKIYFYLFLAFSLLACASKEPEPVDPLANMFQHQVRYQGETLGLISGWYTGKSLNWIQIKSANPGLNENRIKIGDVILIPKEMLKKTEPFTKDFVNKSVSNVVVSSTESPEVTEVKEENIVDLFEEARKSGLTLDEIESDTMEAETIDATAGIFEESVNQEDLAPQKEETNPNITQNLKDKYDEIEELDESPVENELETFE